ncbi:MAG: ATP-dependent RecD-like DNA helicase [Hormoscilla sp.]
MQHSDQLPSVGPGMVLRDLLISEMVPTTRLETIYRQRDESPIIYAAEDVNRGKIPKLHEFKQAKQWMDVGDCAMWETPTLEATARAIVELAVAMKATEVDLTASVMVLAPQKKGICGVSNLNQLLQPIFNPRLPDSTEVEYNEVVYRVNDRVIQLKNRYDIAPTVMNGETGKVVFVDPENKQVRVEFQEGAIVSYKQSELEQIMHSFCLTCHKSQGSEFPYVIMPLLLSNRHMLTRQLLYTTMTRASSTFIAVGQTRALEIAVATDKPARRYTQLQTQLISTVSELTQTFNSLKKKPTAKSATTATVSVAKRIKERGIQVTTGQRTKIGRLTLQLYQDKYGHFPSKQPEQMEDMKFKTKTYHYSEDAVHLIDRAIDIVLHN